MRPAYSESSPRQGPREGLDTFYFLSLRLLHRPGLRLQPLYLLRHYVLIFISQEKPADPRHRRV